MAVEVGKVYVSVRPDTSDFARLLAKELGKGDGAAERVGRDIGRDLADGLNREAKEAGRDAGEEINRQLRRTTDGDDIGRDLGQEISRNLTRSAREGARDAAREASQAFRRGFNARITIDRRSGLFGSLADLAKVAIGTGQSVGKSLTDGLSNSLSGAGGLGSVFSGFTGALGSGLSGAFSAIPIAGAIGGSVFSLGLSLAGSLAQGILSAATVVKDALFSVLRAAGVAAIAAGGLAYVGFQLAKDLAETASSQLAAQQTSKQIFGDMAGIVSSFAATSAAALGVSNAATTQAVNGFGNLFTQLGKTQEEAANLGVTIVQRAADMAAFGDAAPENVIDAISGAFRGEFDPLQKFIPRINAARVEAVAQAKKYGLVAKESTKVADAQERLAEAQEEAAEAAGGSAEDQERANKKVEEALESLEKAQKGVTFEVTDAGKAMAVYDIIMEDSANTIGQVGREYDSLTVQQSVFNAQVEDTKARIGTLLIPAFSALFNVLNTKVLPIVEKAGTELVKGFTGEIPPDQSIFAFIGAEANKLWTFLTTDIFPKIKTAVSAFATGFAGQGTEGVAYEDTFFYDVGEWARKAYENVKDWFVKLGEWIAGFFRGLTGQAALDAQVEVSPVFRQERAQGLIEQPKFEPANEAEGFGARIAEFLYGGGATEFWNKVTEGFKSAWAWLEENWPSVRDTFIALADALKKLIESDWLKTFAETLNKAISHPFEFVIEMAKPWWWPGGGGDNEGPPVGRFGPQNVEPAVYHPPTSGGPQDPHSRNRTAYYRRPEPDLPRFATGGIVMPKPGGTLARLAEAGVPELVLPLNRIGIGNQINMPNTTVIASDPADLLRQLEERARRRAMVTV